MGQQQGIIIPRQLFHAFVVFIFIYLPHGDCNIRNERAGNTITSTTDGPLDVKVGTVRVWQIVAMSLGGILLLVIIISCFVKCRIPESQASRLKRLQEKQRHRQDEVDRPLGRPVPQQPRPNSSYQPHHDPHHVNIQLRQYPPVDYDPQSHAPQYDNRRQTETGQYQPHLPRHSAPPDRYDYRQARQQVRLASNVGRGGQF